MNDMNKTGHMSRKNWVITLSGIAVFFFGLFVMSLVGKDYHGFKGFLAPFLLIFGLLITSLGLIVGEEPHR